jgi:cytochrome c oxidase cbb3-type subunit 3
VKTNNINSSQIGANMHATKKISLLSLIAAMLSPVIVFGATTNPMDKSPDYNYVLLSLVSLVILLVFVIAMLAGTLRQLSFVVRDKNRREKEKRNLGAGTVLLLLAMLLPAFSVFAADAPAAPQTVLISGIPENDFYLLAGVLLFEIIVIFGQVLIINMLLKAIKESPEMQAHAKALAKHSWFWDKFNAAASLEKESEVLLDHNYDGIQELDNSLPPWWKYGFYLTIIVGVIYIYRFHISHEGQSQQEEYVSEMEKGEADKAAYLAKSANNVDENTVTYLTGSAELAAGKELFQKTCVACHLADGGGSVGPNLTDDYWLHLGGIKDIFKSIKYGWQDKGMKSWKDDFSPKEIQELASFVKSLKGTKSATPKAPQGELYIEATTAAPAAADSAKTDTTKAK